MIGHCGSGRWKKSTKIHSLKLSGEFRMLEECAIAKARQKSVKKE
jgi:hypothetical protein